MITDLSSQLRVFSHFVKDRLGRCLKRSHRCWCEIAMRRSPPADISEPRSTSSIGRIAGTFRSPGAIGPALDRFGRTFREPVDARTSGIRSGCKSCMARQELRDERHFPGMQPVGIYAIHIVVKNGRTMLLGVVDTEADRQIAEVRAREVTGVFEAENGLAVARSAKERGSR
jgi:BON domain-containing protein